MAGTVSDRPQAFTALRVNSRSAGSADSMITVASSELNVSHAGINRTECAPPDQQEMVQEFLVLQGERRQFMRQGEDNMDVASGKKLLTTRLEPTVAGAGLTLRAVPVAAAVVRDGRTVPAVKDELKHTVQEQLVIQTAAIVKTQVECKDEIVGALRELKA